MISQRINRKVLTHLMVSEFNSPWNVHPCRGTPIADLLSNNDTIDHITDQMLIDFDGETVQEVQKNVNYALTVSRHILTYDKQDLIWFQQTLGKMKGIRGAFKN